MLVDIGVETYTGKTFSDRRYEIWTMQSSYHNIPAIKGCDELPGAAYCARDVKYSFGGDCSEISMDIAGAYPEEVSGGRYMRSVKLDKGNDTVTITDGSDFDDVCLNFITYEKPDTASIQMPAAASGQMPAVSLHLGEAEMTLTGGTCEAVEVLPITDERLKTAWDHDLYRVKIKTSGSCEISIR